MKAPRNWLVEYTPMADPFLPAGAAREISAGRVASIVLKPVKNTSSATPMATAEPWKSHMPSWASASRPTPSRNTPLLCSSRSANITSGPMRATEPPNTGR